VHRSILTTVLTRATRRTASARASRVVRLFIVLGIPFILAVAIRPFLGFMARFKSILASWKNHGAVVGAVLARQWM
jgi:hypothetical protein